MSMTILTVDDSRTMREMLRMVLSDAGFRVVEADDGINGLEKLRAEPPDVIITDINMPRMDGFGVIEAVRAGNSHAALPILVLTTESAADLKERARKSGATGWIVKPFDDAKLVSAIKRIAGH